MKINILLILFFVIGSCTKKNIVCKISKSEIQVSDTIQENIITTYPVFQIDKRSPTEYYHNAFLSIQNMLEGEESLNFKKAVFITGNAYFENMYDYNLFSSKIENIVRSCESIMMNKKLIYPFSDSTKVKKNAAIFCYYSDTSVFYDKDKIVVNFPFEYDFDDYNGVKDVCY